MADRSTFQKGSGCYACNSCGRKTRVVAQCDHLCPQCDEWLCMENGISDDPGMSAEDRASMEAGILRLQRKAVSLGGKIKGVA